MERRKFLSNIIKYTAVNGVLIATPSVLITDLLTKAWEAPVLPYDYSVFDEDFATKLEKTKHLPKTIRSVSQSRVVSGGGTKSNWGKGEGQGNSYHPKLRYVEQNEVVTPVFDILNYRDVKVFGQFFKQTIGYTPVIRGWDGEFYVVHPSFRTVFTPKLVCYGLPSSNYVVKRCDLCRGTYVYQDFRPCGEKKETIRLYDRWAEGCSKSSNGNHDNVRTKPIPPCDASGDGINID